jgi:quercetin dioxygenase-like cupin family protein
MELRVAFSEEHETGEATFALTSSLRTRGTTPTRRTVAAGIRAVRQFVDEANRGLRPPRSFLRGRIESPAIDRLLREFESPTGLGEPAVRLHQPHRELQQLWPVQDLLGFESQDLVARVQIQPSSKREFFHTHEHSDRLVLLTKGSGELHVCPGETKLFPRDLTRLTLVPGDVVFLARGTAHAFHAGPESAEALVWHCPYVTHGDPDYQTELKATPAAKLVPLKEVLQDGLLLSVLYAVHSGCTETLTLCQELHIDRAAVEQVLRRLESLRMLLRENDTTWRLHPTFRIEQSEGKLELIRDEDGVTARLSAKVRL